MGDVSSDVYLSSENRPSWCGNPPEGLGVVFTNPHWTERGGGPGLAGETEGRGGAPEGGVRVGGVCHGQVTARRPASSGELLLEAESLRGRLGGPGPSGQRGHSHGGLEGRAAQSHLARLHRARPGPQRQGLQVAAQGGYPPQALPGGMDPWRCPRGGLAGKAGGGAAVHTLPSGLRAVRGVGRAPPAPPTA